MIELQEGHRAIELKRDVLELHCFPRELCALRLSALRYKGFQFRTPYLIFRAGLSMVGSSHRPPSDVWLRLRQKTLETLMNIFDLSGRAAIVTGGNGGIGLGIAQALAAAGCSVSIWGRNAEKNKNAAATMAGCAGRIDSRICDVADAASVKAAMAATLETFGRVDGCFANAGIGGGGRHAFIDRTEEQWRTMFATNLDGVFHVFQAAARHMTERAASGDAFGRLVATSSLASLFGTARNEHYAATKAAINALVRALAVELARQGVTANAILPGWIKSDMTAGIMANEKFVANVMPRIPMRRFGEPADFGGIAVYLMSGASSYHTADCFVIDGGYTAF
jgi:NAD(P)-dependent dehydrogenase (short-subunit alcohol dehydrogenase family)